MRTILSVCAALLLASCVAACSVYMEATRPTPVDLNDFQQGMSRDAVLEELGAPDNTALESDGATCDYYKLYTRGYGAGGKIPIAIAEGAADVVTLGLAEIVLTPTEGVTENEKHPVVFCYHGQQLARITGAGKPAVAPDQNPPITAALTETLGVQAVATPAATPGAATASVSAPSSKDSRYLGAVAAAPTANPGQPQTSQKAPASVTPAGVSAPAAAASSALAVLPAQHAAPVANPQVGDQWKSTDNPQ
jgi:hypothetical protein